MKFDIRNGVQGRLRLGVTGLMLVALAGGQLAGVSASGASSVTNPALAKSIHGRFLNTIVLDGGVITVTPAPANVVPKLGLAAASARVWATAELAGFAQQIVGYGYVTMRGTATGESAVTNLLAWIGFANGNTSNVCVKNSAGKFRTNGESAVVLGDAASSAAVSYVPPGCGIAQRSGYRIANEVISVPWVQVRKADSRGQVNFRTTTAQCGSIYGGTRTLSKGVVEVALYAQRPDWSAHACTRSIGTLGMALAKSAAKANALRLVHAKNGPVRQVVSAG